MADDPTHLDNLKALRSAVVEKRREIGAEFARFRETVRNTTELKPSTGYDYAGKIRAIQAELSSIDEAISEEVHALSVDREPTDTVEAQPYHAPFTRRDIA